MIDEKKLIEEIEERYRYWETCAAEYDEAGDEVNMSICDGKAIELYTIIKRINEQSKVGEWIPCSERLPEEARAIEVTMYDGSRAIGHFYKSLEAWFDSINGGAIDVIAWKEPSEPWEERKGMKFTKMGEWCTSADGELFYDGFDTKKEAVESVREEYGEGYIGESVAVEFTADDFNWDADYALGELLYEEVGDVADSWHLSQEDEAELSRRLGEVMVEFLNERNLQPECFKVVNVEPVAPSAPWEGEDDV